ncbi:MAG: hypothetical protein KC425_19040, partial [Anaerolineales bacterium]|nr:hypothetical protein [Anaerolineales bacterium]
MTHLLLATRSGFAAATADPWRITARALNGRSLTSLIAREGTLLAGAEDGLFRSTDGGATWHPADRGLA